MPSHHPGIQLRPSASLSGRTAGRTTNVQITELTRGARRRAPPQLIRPFTNALDRCRLSVGALYSFRPRSLEHFSIADFGLRNVDWKTDESRAVVYPFSNPQSEIRRSAIE